MDFPLTLKGETGHLIRQERHKKDLVFSPLTSPTFEGDLWKRSSGHGTFNRYLNVCVWCTLKLYSLPPKQTFLIFCTRENSLNTGNTGRNRWHVLTVPTLHFQSRLTSGVMKYLNCWTPKWVLIRCWVRTCFTDKQTQRESIFLHKIQFIFYITNWMVSEVTSLCSVYNEVLYQRISSLWYIC